MEPEGSGLKEFDNSMIDLTNFIIKTLQFKKGSGHFALTIATSPETRRITATLNLGIRFTLV